VSGDLSIVIPAYNEAGKIGRDVSAAGVFFREAGLRGEIIVVDDGSRDDTAAEARAAAVPEQVDLRVIRLGRNAGKGSAVRTGILASGGEVVLFADSGSCVPYADALPWIRRLRDGELDLALASRRHPDTVIRRNRPWMRRMISRLFRWAAVLITGLPRRFTDSQCGFKLFRGEAARELFAEIRTTGFLFDVELLLRAVHGGYVIAEFPVRWSCDLDTRLRPRADAPGVLRDLFRVRSFTRRRK